MKNYLNEHPRIKDGVLRGLVLPTYVTDFFFGQPQPGRESFASRGLHRIGQLGNFAVNGFNALEPDPRPIRITEIDHVRDTREVPVKATSEERQLAA